MVFLLFHSDTIKLYLVCRLTRQRKFFTRCIFWPTVSNIHTNGVSDDITY